MTRLISSIRRMMTGSLSIGFVALTVTVPEIPVHGFLVPVLQTSSSPALRVRQHTADAQATNLKAIDSQVALDLAIATTLGLGTDPVVESIFEKNPEVKDDCKNTVLYGVVDSVSTAARIYGVLILLSVFISEFDLPFISSDFDVHQFQQFKAPLVALTVWSFLSVCKAKRIVLKNLCSGKRMGRVALYDHLIDFVAFIVTVWCILNELSIDIGTGVQSVFAAGGLGALTFSLASKDLAENIVGGALIQAWDAVEVGEDVKLGDGTEGKIKRIGLVETEITGYDDIVVRIPNSQLSTQRVSNISRIQKSRVLQIIRFRYSDIKKVPKILQDILTEISDSCPKLIKDGDRPFRALLTSYEADHIQAVVVCHFTIQPGTGEFAETRQEVLLAIARAFEANQAEFALPSIHYKTSNNSGETTMF